MSVCELEYERVTPQPKQTLLLEDATLLIQPQPVTSSSVQGYRSGDESRHGDAVTKVRCLKRLGRLWWSGVGSRCGTPSGPSAAPTWAKFASGIFVQW